MHLTKVDKPLHLCLNRQCDGGLAVLLYARKLGVMPDKSSGLFIRGCMGTEFNGLFALTAP